MLLWSVQLNMWVEEVTEGGGSACPEVSHQVTLRSEDTQGALGFRVKGLNHRNKWQRDVAKGKRPMLGCRKTLWGEKGISLKTGPGCERPCRELDAGSWMQG